ncbi:MAG: hypothetical protein Q8N56_01125 [bacterium]|nr:hypothetical protein [bacterium]
MKLATKIIGLLLLLLGLAIVFYAVYNSYNIFTGKIVPPPVFTFADSIPAKSNGTSLSAFGFEVQLGDLFGEQKEQMSAILGSLPRLLNLLSWSVFAGILIFAGTQIAGLGIKLIK